jgi:hypothetical protein
MDRRVNTLAECTVPEKILLAAWELEEQGQSPFSAEALIVASWQKFPRAFGLKGYTDQYPDSNKVLASIMGEKGLARRGWLVKMGQKLYALTRDGRHVVRRLLSDGSEPIDLGAAEPVKLTREQEKFLLALLSSAAVEKYQEGRKQELTFADATRYWGITENLRGEALDARLNRVRANLADYDRTLGHGATTLSSGRSVSAEDLGLLLDVHAYLEDKFSRHLTLLRNRVERS